LRTSAHGATRRTGSGNVLDVAQAVEYEEWLRAYTAGAAYAGGQESERGTLAPGLRADLVVLEGRLDGERPPAVSEVWVAGRLEHQADVE
jgi:predicted amidohydrolase YtcJ